MSPSPLFPRTSLVRCLRAHGPRHSRSVVSLGLFRDKKLPKTDPSKCAVPSIYGAATSGTLYPALRLHSAVAARPKRETRRLPLFPDGEQWTGILGDSVGDDALIAGKYYLGTNLPQPPTACWTDGRCRGWRRRMEYKRERASGTVGTATNALLGYGM